ncbi:hypothetical protein QAD02_001997 [Eretmocerus hayati]|uniref:Uncharacterized protein n=1 Tax=Eretmocerus hayati TaxID=131215 RepID=A0ACC2NIK3_9HYME|nr:hypothetical protein QAD02_001997 [Eretmocerus hayati]
MDSKKKFNKNRYWKQKNKPRNITSSATVTNNKKQPEPRNVESSNTSDESDDDTLKQPVPVGGWFPESDASSSDSENFEVVLPNLKQKASPDLQGSSSGFQKSSKNFDQEVIKTHQDTKNNPEKDPKQLKSKEPVNTELKSDGHGSKLPDGKTKSTEKDRTCPDEDDDELEFLLSLKDPIHTGPLVAENSIGNERRLPVPSNSFVQQKPVKTIDLEKWLDSVLDD